MNVELNGGAVTLMYEKALYRAGERLLVIADVHLGKASHFRREGISIPANAQEGDYHNLRQLLNKVQPLKVYFLGDLFHSTFNGDWHNFCELIAAYPHISFTLIKGNHDLIDPSLFTDLCIDMVDTITDEHFIYSHEPLKVVPAGLWNIAGHIHPGFTLSGLGRQSLKLPCFYVASPLVVLPAFGILTGLYGMQRTPQSQVYIVLPDGVRRV